MKFTHKKTGITIEAISISDAKKVGMPIDSYIKDELIKNMLTDDDYIITWNDGTKSASFKRIVEMTFKPI